MIRNEDNEKLCVGCCYDNGYDRCLYTGSLKCAYKEKVEKLNLRVGKCDICGKTKMIGTMGCMDIEVCLMCFNLIQNESPDEQARWLIEHIVKPQIDDALRMSRKHLN
jgi:hypothetical protein